MTAPLRRYSLESLPGLLPVFPLSGVLLLPRGRLPLNIFEPRYIAMLEDAIRGDRLIGMVQPRSAGGETAGDAVPLFATGCAGRVSAFEETDDGRYLITLSGVCRFRIEGEEPLHNGYRRVRPGWEAFARDLDPPGCLDIDRGHLKKLLSGYFEMHEISCDWEMVDGTPDDALMTCLAMVCPLTACEKQALLEAQCCAARAKMFMTMLEMAVKGEKSCDGKCH